MDGSWAMLGDTVINKFGWQAEVLAFAGEWVQIKYVSGPRVGYEDCVKDETLTILGR